jgi:ribonucleoside-diphosphate reductase alpha chain
MERNPTMIEESVWSTNGTDYILSVPDIAPEGSIFKRDLLNEKQLEFVKKAQQVWVEHGTNEHLCVDSRLRHNVSNTIVVDDWEAVTKYVWENRAYFAGISFLAASGDKDYPQAPFTEVLTEQQILDTYGVGSMFASGLIEAGVAAFNNNLWAACSCALGIGEVLEGDSHTTLLKRDWVRRANKFANKYCGGDIKKATYCLKDVYNLHKWEKIQATMVDIDWVSELQEQEYTDIDTMGAQACSGGACEIVGL